MKLFIGMLGGGIIGLIISVCGFHYDNLWYWILMIPLNIIWIIINELLWPRIR